MEDTTFISNSEFFARVIFHSIGLWIFGLIFSVTIHGGAETRPNMLKGWIPSIIIAVLMSAGATKVICTN